MRAKMVTWLVGGWLGLTTLAGVAGAEGSPPGLAARWHFGGLDRLPALGTNASRLSELVALPVTRDLEQQIVTNLAMAPFRFLRHKVGPQAIDHPELLGPLVTDLLHGESYLELWGPTNAVPGLLLAVRVKPNQAALWSTNLASVISGWTGIPVVPVRLAGASGWELKKHHNPNVIRLLRAGDWVVFGWGQDAVTGETAMLQRIQSQGGPGRLEADQLFEGWVAGKLLSTRAVPWLPVKLPTAAPSVQLTMGIKADYVRTKAVLQFEEPLQISLPPWKPATNSMDAPLVAFTAVRGISPLLRRLPVFAAASGDTVPEQLSAWAAFGAVFNTSFAFPSRNPTNSVKQIGDQLVGQVNMRMTNGRMGQFRWNANQTVVEWASLPPMIGPFLRAEAKTNGDFVLGGMFALPTRRQAPPPELLEQLAADPKLVYYDWEITGERIKFWRNCFILYSIVGLGNPVPERAFHKFLGTIAPKLDNTVTEVAMSGPAQLTLTRKSPLGFSAPELLFFARWLDSTGFPLAFAPPPPPPLASPTPKSPAGHP